MHQSDCPNLKALPHIQERLIGAFWEDLEQEKDLPGIELEILAVNRGGLVNEITSILMRYSVTINSLKTQTQKENQTANIFVSFDQVPYAQLHKIVDKITHMHSVIQVQSHTYE